jgi:SAM-dependent methyltransferase
MSLREAWDAQAEAWVRFVRDPAGDRTNLLFNLPRFLELVPPPGRRTLDLGCGEGRLGAELQQLGHRVVGVDSSPAMVEAASELIEATVADAPALPFEDGAFDLVAAFMSLQDMDDLHGAVREAARVLEPGGRFCFNVLHPIASTGSWKSRGLDSAFTVGSYFERQRHDDVVERDGHRVVFSYIHRPLETYARALEEAGFFMEALREPRPPERYLNSHPLAPRLLRVPLFIHLRAVKQKT